MKLQTIFNLAKDPDDVRSVQEFYSDRSHVFLVDWREDPFEIPSYVSNTTAFPIEIASREVPTIAFRGRSTSFDLPPGSADKTVFLRTLNELLCGDYEIRLAMCSVGNDTLAFCNLSPSEWRSVEDCHPIATELFMPLDRDIDLFNDLMRLDVLDRYKTILDSTQHYVSAIYKALQPPPSWQELALSGASKMMAIKAYASQHGRSLPDAKKAVDEYVASQPPV